MNIVVVGAHLSGLPLNHQLTSLNGTFVAASRTEPVYRLYALPETNPPKPGLLRAAEPTGVEIDVEVWDLAPEAFAEFVNAVPPPLCIGNIALQEGQKIKGFLCESYALAGATDITHFGGWRKYLASLK